MFRKSLSIILCFVIMLSAISVYPLSASSRVIELVDSGATSNQKNIVGWANYLYGITWTAKHSVTGWKYTFSQGETSHIPYSQPVYTNGYIGYGISVDDFIAATNDTGSKFYTDHSYYNRTSPYYGMDCSSFVSLCWGVGRKTTATIPNISREIGNLQNDIDKLELGDAINYDGPGEYHVILVTGISRDSNGTVTNVEITEETPPELKRTNYTRSQLINRYFTRYPYTIYRYEGTVPIPPNSEPDYVNLGDSFYAVLGNSDNSKAIGLDESNTVIVCPYKGTNDQRWHFIRQSDGGYKIINVCTDTYLVGDNIASLEYEAGHNNKVWYIMKDYSGEKLCLTHYSGETIKWLHPAWESWTDGTQITLNDAESCLNINIVNEFSYVNLGDNFYAMIANQSNNKAIGLDSDNNVKVFPYQGYNDEIWHFIRQNDGGYKVINVLTDTYLVGDNIASLEYEAGHNNKIWYIMNGSSGSNLCLTHYSSGELRWLHPAYEYWEDGTQITLNDAESCVNINIVKGEGNKPEGFSIITEEQTITEGNRLKIEWNKSKFANQYNVSIWKDDGEHLVYTQTRNNFFVMNDLKAGYYGVYINAENHLGQTDYTSIHFTVVENTTEPTEPPTTPMEPTIPTEPKTIILGDVDGDGEVTIIDATAIQRHLASIPTASYNEKAADADGDGEVTILDATEIQRHLAQLQTNENIGKPIT